MASFQPGGPGPRHLGQGPTKETLPEAERITEPMRSPRCELQAARSLVVAGADHRSGGSLSKSSAADGVAVFLCCTVSSPAAAHATQEAADTHLTFVAAEL